ncbi:hypothetical protein [Catellatospora sichuanensis]|uniref:hypothetical protein n=1 Tax=Catellatospora sichuanensis TaxID=1969805 RepID=UPI00118216E4|nr:hypothetical protein [Catellatospora sichuanensis]
MNRREYGCQICAHVLNRYADEHGIAVYEHPLVLGPVDHGPVVVPADRLDKLRRVCDFCGSGTALLLFIYRTSPISAVAVSGDVQRLEHYGTDWSACAACSHWLAAAKPAKLLDRAAAISGLPHGDIGLAVTGHLQRAVLNSLLPGRILITTSEWPAMAPPARAMPKVRDRLARLLRGPDVLGAPALVDAGGDVADTLDQGPLYYVDAQFSQMAEHAAAVLPDAAAVPELAPSQHGLLVWATPVGDINAASWSSRAGGWLIVRYRGISTDGHSEEAAQHLRDAVGWLLPTHAAEIGYTDAVGAGHPAAALLATWLLIGQESVAATEPAEVDPPIRKAYQRAGRPAPDVRLVRIRGTARTEAGSAATERTGSGRTHRWWTSGHWRNQAYGRGRALRRPVYINPFLKGSADLPIRQSTTVRVLGTLVRPAADGEA